VGLSRKHVLRSVEASLRRLGTDHAQLDRVSAVETPYPYDFIERSSMDRPLRTVSG
jgi:aryl-alcohol dehydrogenase-like predicted oxidoreductase